VLDKDFRDEHRSPVRQRINLNRDWLFTLGDPIGAEAVDYDDSHWQRVGLPHTFDLPYFRTPEFYVGVGWYRKRFDAIPATHRHFLEFDGIFQIADIYINGEFAGHHEGGYTGFQIDVSDHLTQGPNLLAVRVDNNWSPQLAPRAGEHFFGGGIYRDVHMTIANPLHIEWNGVSITTPSVSRQFATVRIRTEVNNSSSSPIEATILSAILNPSGDRVTTVETTCTFAPGLNTVVDQISEALADPKLWHPNDPHLYTVCSLVEASGQSRDYVETQFGFRWFEWTADRGFFLNGERLYLRGANAHQDHAGWGIAITQAAMWRDARLIKEAGFNFVRGAHYPHHPAFAAACDHLGLLYWSENCFWGKGGFGPEGYWNASAYPVNAEDFEPFEEHCKQTLREMIRINRNHPSIIAWSMTNEAFFTYNIDRAKRLVKDLVKLSHELDPSRPAAIGGAQRGDFDKLGDIAGYNGDGARLFFEPGVPNMVSEYGAISKPHDAYDPFFGDLQAEKYPWRSGEAIWCGFDYGSIAGRQGLKGIVDHFRVPKRSWYWYRNEYRNIPPPPWPQPGTPAKLRLTADRTTIRGTDAIDDCQIEVTVLDTNDEPISNCPPVTLTIESGPGEFPTGPSITFEESSDIKITAGRAAIAFRSYHGGATVIRATSPGLEPATIVITTEGEPRFVPGVTPPAPARPYTPPPQSAAAINAAKNAVNVALNRPCRASSESDGHPARNGNDGSIETFWSTADSSPGAGAWWQVDLEGFYQLASVRLTFASPQNYRFNIETSDDAACWALVVDRRETVNTAAVRNDIFPPGAVARYVRVTFTHVPDGARANLAEIELLGVLAPR
jgi:hypothetical protein